MILNSKSLIPPKEDSYYPFQEEGIKFALGRKHALIGDEMGLGKTMQAIGVANNIYERDLIVVICPSFLRLRWQKAFNKWFTEKHTTHLFEKSSFKAELNPDTKNILIISYDLLWKSTVYEQLIHREIDLFIFDEAHYVKNIRSKRSKKTLEIAKMSSRSVALTGTPVTNRPIELYAILSQLAPDVIKPHLTYKQFATYYCAGWDAPWGFDATGSSNSGELAERLKSYMIRRLKKNVLPDLPDKIHQVIPIKTDKKTKELLLREEKIINQEDYQKSKKIPAKSLGKYAELRQKIASAKIPASVEHIKCLMSEVNKLVIFAHHKIAIKELTSLLKEYNPLVITGECGSTAREKIECQFQNDNKHRIFIGQIQASGVGIDLTRANHILFFEPSWVPGETEQAIDRCHRIGQDKKVHIQFMVLEDSLDAHIIKSVIKKQSTITKLLDGENNMNPMKQKILDISEQVKSLAVSLEGLAELFEDKPESNPKKKKTTVKKVEVSIGDVRKAIQLYAKTNGKDAALSILGKFGVSKLADLKEKDYNAVIGACND